MLKPPVAELVSPNAELPVPLAVLVLPTAVLLLPLAVAVVPIAIEGVPDAVAPSALPVTKSCPRNWARAAHGVATKPKAITPIATTLGINRQRAHGPIDNCFRIFRSPQNDEPRTRTPSPTPFLVLLGLSASTLPNMTEIPV